jgi:hypothetical protein
MDDEHRDDRVRNWRDELERVNLDPRRQRINWDVVDRRRAEVNAVDRAAKLEIPPNNKNIGSGKRRKTRRRKTRRRSK